MPCGAEGEDIGRLWTAFEWLRDAGDLFADGFELRSPVGELGGLRRVHETQAEDLDIFRQADREAFADFYAEYDKTSGLSQRLGARFVVNGPITYSDTEVKRDIANLKAAASKVNVAGAFGARG